YQAEDGIRVFHVTGVQTCALPIYELRLETCNLTSIKATFIAFWNNRVAYSITGKIAKTIRDSFQLTKSITVATTTILRRSETITKKPSLNISPILWRSVTARVTNTPMDELS